MAFVLTRVLVVNMAKEKRWEDVRLLSFDLQTVEFTYASVYIMTLLFDRSMLIFYIGLHALHLVQGPTPHGRFVQPPLQASPIPRRSPRPPPKPTLGSRALLPRAPTPWPPRRCPPGTRFRPA